MAHQTNSSMNFAICSTCFLSKAIKIDFFKSVGISPESYTLLMNLVSSSIPKSSNAFIISMLIPPGLAASTSSYKIGVPLMFFCIIGFHLYHQKTVLRCIPPILSLYHFSL